MLIFYFSIGYKGNIIFTKIAIIEWSIDFSFLMQVNFEISLNQYVFTVEKMSRP